jgi:hypothetical protein
MRKAKDLTGVKTGIWTIGSFSHKGLKGKYWHATCGCGHKSTIRQDVIINKRSLSCGKCDYHNQLKRDRGYTGWNRMEDRTIPLINNEWAIYKGNAREDKRDFLLTKDDFKNFIFDNCHYCRREPYRIKKDKFSDEQITINGVDRIDSNIGYIVKNCVTCCSICNTMKNTLSVQEFKEHIVLLHSNLDKF